MKNETFDRLRNSCEIWLHAANILMIALTDIWGIPYGLQIAATIAAIGTFVGAVVGVQRKNYTEGK